MKPIIFYAIVALIPYSYFVAMKLRDESKTCANVGLMMFYLIHFITAQLGLAYCGSIL